MDLVEPPSCYDLAVRHAAGRRKQALVPFSSVVYERALRELSQPGRVFYLSDKSDVDCAFFAELFKLFSNGHLRHRGAPLECCVEPLANASEFVMLGSKPLGPSEAEKDNAAVAAILEARYAMHSAGSSPQSACSEDDGDDSSDSIEREMGKTTFSAVEELCGASARTERHRTGRLRVCSHLAVCLVLMAVHDAIAAGRLVELIPLRFVSYLVASPSPPPARSWLHWNAAAQIPSGEMRVAMLPIAAYVNAEQFLADQVLGTRVDPGLMSRYLERRLHGHVEMLMHLHQRACWYSSHDPQTGAPRPMHITHRQALKAVYYAFVLWEFEARPDAAPASGGHLDVHELATSLEAICNSCTCIEPTFPAHNSEGVCGYERDEKHKHRSVQHSFLTLGKGGGGDARDLQRLWQLHSLVRWSIYHGTCLLPHHPRFRSTPPERMCARLPLLIDQALPSTREMGIRHDSEPLLVAYSPVPTELLRADVGSHRPGTASLVERFACATDGRGGPHGAAVVRFATGADLESALVFFSRLLAPENRLVAMTAQLLSESSPTVIRTERYAYVLLRRWMLRAARAFSVYRVLGSRRSSVGTSGHLNAEYIMQEYLRGDTHELYYAMKLLWQLSGHKTRAVGHHADDSTPASTRRTEDSLEPVGAADRCPADFYRALHRLVGKATEGCGTTLRQHVSTFWRRATCWRIYDRECPRDADADQPISGLLFEPPAARGGPEWQVRNDRLPAYAIADACPEPFLPRALQSFLEMRLPHFVNLRLVRELLQRFGESQELADRHWRIYSVLQDAMAANAKLSMESSAAQFGLALPLTYTFAAPERTETYPHWLLYQLALDDAIEPELAYRIFCGTLTHSGFALRPRPALSAKLAECDVEDVAWDVMRDLGKRKAEEIGGSFAPADPARRDKFGAHNRATRPSAADEDARFAAARRAAEQRPLLVADDDVSALWELIQIVCSEARVSSTPHRARLLVDDPLETSYKYVIEPERSSRPAALQALLAADYDGLPGALPCDRIAADCDASRVTSRIAASGPMSMLAVRDDSVVRRCLFEGSMPPQPCYYTGVNNYRMPSLCELLPTRALLRVLVYVEDRRPLRRVCRQWRTLIDRILNVLSSV